MPIRKKCRFPLNYTFAGDIANLLELDVEFKFRNASNPFLKLKLQVGVQAAAAAFYSIAFEWLAARPYEMLSVLGCLKLYLQCF